MKIAKKRCEFCHEWFDPHPRSPHQRYCAKLTCQKARKARADKNWRLNNPGYGKGRKSKIRTWAKKYPDYWHNYRRTHPAYTVKDNRRRCSSYKRDRISAKQDAVRQIYVDKLESIRDLEAVSSAKQDVVHRRINELVNCLIWKESSAKQDGLANCLVASP